MRLIKPYYQIESNINGNAILASIEKAGRTCYKSEDKITDDSAKKFVAMILKRGHESVLEHISFSVRFISDRGVSHEIVRHRLASFSQESTRYCDYNKNNDITFIIPPWLDYHESTYTAICHDFNPVGAAWLQSLLDAETTYKFLIKNCWKPEQARSVLPNSLKTEIVVSANLREWRHIFKLRTAPAAHPQMRELMIPLLAEIKNLIPVVYDDIIVQ